MTALAAGWTTICSDPRRRGHRGIVRRETRGAGNGTGMGATWGSNLKGTIRVG
jgi:hypothetical protein